ncbi:hypothetical protein GJA_2272 [Janthinobacterium agaricidamnosum NBRC 102515 = DSM 9628]|uniref:Uncharacterized protein n=1 Tax=Janthinobacterium agaricidamnosum NBRC 102515 = DSM 9628 TaxID=1349767 RepID=W0V4W0_9BURK|nr:hypothetical protein GJA_2272 [Janthinobacterium agaricidamnosum NBRC 102515 = DSM 9628]
MNYLDLPVKNVLPCSGFGTINQVVKARIEKSLGHRLALRAVGRD